MLTEKSLLISRVLENLFKDGYGILALAAHATLTKTPASSKVIGHFLLKLVQWASSVLVIVQLFWHNSVSFSDFVWVEPDTRIFHVIWEEYLQKERK